MGREESPWSSMHEARTCQRHRRMMKKRRHMPHNAVGCHAVHTQCARGLQLARITYDATPFRNKGMSMSLPIITAIRRLPQLKGALKFTAIELAHRASSSGYVRVAYSYLAQKTGLSVRTMIRHVQRLEALGILRKQRVWISAHRCAVNVYTLLVSNAMTLHRCASDKVAKTLPDNSKREAKWGTLGEAIRQLERGMRLLTPGSVPYASCLARLQTLRDMQRQLGEGS